MPSRSALTWAMYHQVRTWSSLLTASRKLSRRRLPRVGARTWASAIASRGGLRLGPSDLVSGTASLTHRPARQSAYAVRCQPQTGQGLEPDCA